MAKRFKPFTVGPYLYDALQSLIPPERLSVSEWAEKYRILDSRYAAMPGPWSNEVTPYLVGIMDEFNNPETREIVFCKPTQVGGTSALENMVGYVVMQDPSPTMIVYPNKDLAKSVSENRLQPMLLATPEIAKKFDENSEMLELQFDGMYLTLAGSNSPAGLASKPIRYLFLDEVDKYPDATRREADPIKLATERTKSFTLHNTKIFITSTPTIKEGHIWKAKEAADVEKHFFVPCPHCGEYIELLWSQVEIPKDEGMSYKDRADLAVYRCQGCKGIITDNDKHNILRLGEWQVVRQSKKYASSVAFWMNTLYSPFVRWSDIAAEWLKSQDDTAELQNFINSWLAEPWEDTKMTTKPGLVFDRQTDLEPYVIPDWAKILTAGVDVQETSFYWTIRAWGDYLTSQNIAHGQALSWQEVDDVMNLEYLKENGDPMVVSLCLVDSGDQTDMVYDFCVTHSDYAVACKGANHAQLSPYKISKINKENSRAYGMQLVLVDGGAYKDMIAGRMRRENGRGSWMVYNGVDEEYAKQVTAEHKVTVKKNGVTKQVWQPKTKHIDNHFLDCEVYALAAADIKGVRTLHLNEAEEEENPASQTREQIEDSWIQAHDNWLQ